MNRDIGSIIAARRRELGLTQQKLAESLNVSFQAVSKWEKGATMPDISLLPQLAHLLNTSVDFLVGYAHQPITEYESRYNAASYYWGTAPNRLCYDVMHLRPPVRPLRLLDIGCGEGKDAVFFARNGYIVSAFDAAETGLEKARELAKLNGVSVDFFRADINSYEPDGEFDIVFSSGVFHYLIPERRHALTRLLKEHTSEGGLHALNVFVQKPFIAMPPDSERAELEAEPWHSGELFVHYHDWLFHRCEETVFDCSSGGVPHQHCMDVLIAEKKL